MSAIAKILIVLNLLLAVAFLGAAATFLGQQENWKLKHEQLTERTTTEIQGLNDALASARNDQRTAEQNASQAQADLKAVRDRFEQKESDYTTLSKSHNELIAKYDTLSKTYQDIVNQNKTLQQEKNALIDDKDAALTAKRAAIEAQNNAETEQKRLEGELADVRGQLAELNKKMMAMADENESLTIQLQAYQERYPALTDLVVPPKIDAQVTGVDNDLNIVLLSVGRDDQVKPGYSFTVYRGNEYVGKIMIDKVEKDYASGYSVKELQKHPIEVGDTATTGF